MIAGNTFYRKDQYGRPHLYVVISDPQKKQDDRFPGYVFAVMFSTYEKYRADSCTVDVGEHPFIERKTEVVYRMPPAIFTPLSELLHLPRGENASTDLLAKLRAGYLKSKYQTDNITQFLFRQGVIE